jgi:hypothetical protein
MQSEKPGAADAGSAGGPPAALRSTGAPPALPALRDAAMATGAVLLLVCLGSRFGRDLDHALLGYLGAVLAAAFGVAWRSSAFWRRPASAVYGRALLQALRDPRRLRAAVAGAGRHVVGQEMIARRSRLRWLAHLLLSLGTLASFAITLPLVFGWLHFEAVSNSTYQIVFFGLPLPGHQFAIDGAVGFLMFHALSFCGVAVALGAAYFIAARWRRRGEPGAMASFHLAPLVLLLAVALTGLALPLSRTMPGAFHAAALLHELTVAVLLAALPFSKLNHLFIRPLQLGALVVRAPGAARSTCVGCGADLAPRAQAAAVGALLAARGFAFAAHVQHCQPCRRRLVATTQAQLLGADFHPRLTGLRPAPPKRAEAA